MEDKGRNIVAEYGLDIMRFQIVAQVEVVGTEGVGKQQW